ncbi:MAG: phosphatase PAP2 family protein [Chloroflexi bacterium]|jgi:membrane-associated phospholipid phosphatase|nr:phosphatase PAP2 family protein [Chloroflexota bacterium]
MTHFRPRDHHVADRIGGVRAARLFSNIVSPPVMFAVVGLVVTLTSVPFWQALAWAAVFGFFVSLAPILFVLYLLRTGRVVELHMSNTSERNLPYLVAILGSLVVWGLIALLDGPKLLRCLTQLNIVSLAAIAVVNRFWLISFHAMAAAAMSLVLGLIFGPLAGIVLIPLIGVVVAVRLYLRRHTVAQVIAGMLLGVGCVLFMVRLGCF